MADREQPDARKERWRQRLDALATYGPPPLLVVFLISFIAHGWKAEPGDVALLVLALAVRLLPGVRKLSVAGAEVDMAEQAAERAQKADTSARAQAREAAAQARLALHTARFFRAEQAAYGSDSVGDAIVMLQWPAGLLRLAEAGHPVALTELAEWLGTAPGQSDFRRVVGRLMEGGVLTCDESGAEPVVGLARQYVPIVTELYRGVSERLAEELAARGGDQQVQPDETGGTLGGAGRTQADQG